MPVHYSLPGAELYHMKPGLPGSFNEPVLPGSEQSYIIDNFGKTVNQSVGTEQVNINLRVIEWHTPSPIKCHYSLLPGMFTRIVISEGILEKIRGVHSVHLEPGQFFSLIGNSFTTMVAPELPGTYVSIGLWWSAEFLKDIVAEHAGLRKKFDSIIDGYPKGMIAPPLTVTAEMSETVDTLLHFDYTQPGVNKFLHEKMKKLARMVIKESVELNEIRKQFSSSSWEKISRMKNILDDAPMKEISISELSEQLELSASTIKRGIRALGLQGFQEYQKTNKIIEAGLKILKEKDLIKNISRFAGYKHGGNFSEEFKKLFWCTPSLFDIENQDLKINTSYRISNTDKFKYGSIIARYMSERETAEDLEALYGWLVLHSNHLQLFGQLLDETKTTWTREWFDDADVKHNKIRWKKEGGWYRYDLGRAEQVEFYKYAGLLAIYCIIYYFFGL